MRSPYHWHKSRATKLAKENQISKSDSRRWTDSTAATTGTNEANDRYHPKKQQVLEKAYFWVSPLSTCSLKSIHMLTGKLALRYRVLAILDFREVLKSLFWHTRLS